MTRKEQLKADLLKNFSDFQKIDPNVAPGGSDAANSIVASGLAESIDRAIDDGVEFSFQGVFAVKDINAIQEKAPGYLYTCSDSGILKAKTELPVVKNTVVLWNGEDFKTFLVIPEATGSSVQVLIDGFLSLLSSNPVQNKVVTSAINALQLAVSSHTQNTNNPHQVTAQQVGADPAGTASSAISAHNTNNESHADIRLSLLAKEDISNKSQSVDDSSTSYPSGAAVKVYVAEETAEIIETLEDETTARQVADELLQGQIDELSQTQTDWDEDDSSSLAYLKNHPQPISALDIEALFS